MAAATKPAKPYPDFPLYAHACGKWCKKIKGQNVYFGTWNDPESALQAYESLVGPKPVVTQYMTLRHGCNTFLTAKKAAETSGELSPRSWLEYFRTCKRLVDMFADKPIARLTVADFTAYKAERSKTYSLVAVGNEITRVKTIFKWLVASKHCQLPDYSPDFCRAPAKSLRRERRLKGKKLFNQEQIKTLMCEAGTHLTAMLYLGINCAFGPTDVAVMPLQAADLNAGVIDYPRQKTEVPRIIPLWPETVQALNDSLAMRYTPRSDSKDKDRFFVLANGTLWDSNINPVCKRFRQTRDYANIPAGGFYWLRSTFATIAGGSKDQVAVNAIMGHVDPHISAVYRQEIELSRLKAVTDYVRTWLYEKREETKPKPR